jgi:ATP-dependent Clp protease protease subunit
MTVFDDRVNSIMGGVAPNNALSPYILKESEHNMMTQDIFSHLMNNRIIFFGDEFNSDTCNIAIAQILYMNQQDPEKDIDIYINSPGGAITDCFGLLSTMEAVNNDIRTTAIGMAASCGNLLLVSGTVGKRSALPLSKLLVHQPLGGARGQASDIVIEANFITELKEDIANIYMRQTGLTHNEIWSKMDRDNWVRPEQAIPGKDWGTKGLIDQIITKI